MSTQGITFAIVVFSLPTIGLALSYVTRKMERRYKAALRREEAASTDRNL